MANRIQKLIYNLSVASPLLFVFAFVWYKQEKTWNVPLVCLIIGSVLLILFYLSFWYAKKHLSIIDIRTAQIAPHDIGIVVYIFSYVVPFTSIAIKDFNVIVTGMVAVSIVLMVPFVNSVILNPLLFVLGYHFYKVSGEHGIGGYILISKRKLRKNKDVKSVKQMFEFLLLDKEA